MRRMVLPGVFALVALATGCAGEDDSARQCEIPGVGSGACCDLLGASGERLPGACINGFCSNGATQQPNPTCGGSPIRDMGRMIGDANLGGMGGQGGVGGEGGVGGDGGMGGVGGDGGMGGEGGDGGMGGEGGDGGMGGGGNPCAEAVCDPGDRCNPATGVCEAPPAGACAEPAECPDGECLADLPGGFCLVACADDAGCGAGRCLPSGDNMICFNRCNDGVPCRDGWTCAPVTDAEGNQDGAVCVPDCRVGGCGRGQVCNEDTGLCDQEPLRCRFPCGAGEACTEGRCVRANGTCVTDYHCDLDSECRDGRCVAAALSECQGVAGCDASQTCLAVSQNPNDPGRCFFNCQNDEQCELHHMCYAQQGVCFFRNCGPGDEGMNGQIRGACVAGANGQWPGTCQPVVTDPGAPELGFCFEAGDVPEGGACNAQADGRDAANRAQQCGQGLTCFGDPDDVLDPAQNFDGTGNCVRMCDPRNPICGANTRCIDLAGQDTRNLGLCLTTDCSVRQNDCDGGERCLPITATDDAGQCSPPGGAAIGEQCITNQDCADHAICANAGGAATCYTICDPDADGGCPMGEDCILPDGWAFGVCL